MERGLCIVRVEIRCVGGHAFFFYCTRSVTVERAGDLRSERTRRMWGPCWAAISGHLGVAQCGNGALVQ